MILVMFRFSDKVYVLLVAVSLGCEDSVITIPGAIPASLCGLPEAALSTAHGRLTEGRVAVAQ